MKSPRVAIIGRPNVGKSTLFNRLIGKRKAIVDDMPGVTRDRNYAICEWNGIPITMIDTGGYSLADREDIPRRIAANVEQALAEADLVLFVVDGRSGCVTDDQLVAHILHKSKLPVVLTVNKIDHLSHEVMKNDFYQLGFKLLETVSAIQGMGTGDMLDTVLKNLPDPKEWRDEREEGEIAVAIVGRPNVGKSTLLNRLLGEERSLTAPSAGTTRDPVDAIMTYKGKKLHFVDTAGLRRRGKPRGVEKWSVLRASDAINRSHVTLLMIDADEGPTETDAHVFSVAHKAGCAAILVVNKWDLVKKDNTTSGELAKNLRDKYPYLHYAPIITISALIGQRAHSILDRILLVYESHQKRITTSDLNKVMEGIVERHPPAMTKGHRPRLYYASQVRVGPPTFALFSNHPESFHFSYQRYIVNQLYAAYGFEGTPLVVHFRNKNRSMKGEGY
jgi:GTPase